MGRDLADLLDNVIEPGSVEANLDREIEEVLPEVETIVQGRGRQINRNLKIGRRTGSHG